MPDVHNKIKTVEKQATHICRMNKLIVIALIALSVVLLVKADRDSDDNDDDGYYDQDDRHDSDWGEVNDRRKRGIRGTYRENTNKKSKSYRQVLQHRTKTDSEGRVSTDTRRHHERAGAHEQSSKSGSFGFSNRGDNRWFDRDDGHHIDYFKRR